MPNSINNVTITLNATINGSPKQFTAVYGLTEAQGVRLLAFIQGVHGVDPTTGETRTPVQMADAFTDGMFADVRRTAIQYLRSQAAALEPQIDFTRS